MGREARAHAAQKPRGRFGSRGVWLGATGAGLLAGAVALWNIESWRWIPPSAEGRPAASASDAAQRGGPAPSASSLEAFDYMLRLRGSQVTPDLAAWFIAVADGHPRIGTRRQALQCMGWALYRGPDSVWARPAEGEVRAMLENRIAAGLDDADGSMRAAALNAALSGGILGLPEVSQRLPGLLRDPDPHVRVAAAAVAGTSADRDNPR